MKKKCYFTEISENYQTLKAAALKKFDGLIEDALQRTNKLDYATRIAFQLRVNFETILKFLVDSDLSTCQARYDCQLRDEIFGDSRISDAETLINSASELAQSLEKSCPEFSFANFYVRLNL